MNIFQLKKDVCKIFGFSQEDLEGKERLKTRVLARVVFTVRAIKECKASYREIGMVMGNRKSSVIAYYVRKAKKSGLWRDN